MPCDMVAGNAADLPAEDWLAPGGDRAILDSISFVKRGGQFPGIVREAIGGAARGDKLGSDSRCIVPYGSHPDNPSPFFSSLMETGVIRNQSSCNLAMMVVIPGNFRENSNSFGLCTPDTGVR